MIRVEKPSLLKKVLLPVLLLTVISGGLVFAMLFFYLGQPLIFSVAVFGLFLLIYVLFHRLFNRHVMKHLEQLASDVVKSSEHVLSNRYETAEFDPIVDAVEDLKSIISKKEKELTKNIDTISKNEKYIQKLLNTQPSIIFVLKKGKVTSANKAFFDFFNAYSSVEMFNDHTTVGQHFVKEEGYVSGLNDTKWVSDIYESNESNHLAKIGRNNKEVIFKILASYLKDEDAYIVVMTDVSEIEEAKQTIIKNSKSLEEYAKALDAATIVAKVDLTGKIKHVNELFVELSGFEEKSLLENQFVDFLSQKLLILTNELFNSEKVWKGVLKLKNKKESDFYVDTTVVPIFDTKNQIIEYIVIGHDITKQIDATNKAKGTEKLKGQFLANMSHEIRTPLNGMLGFSKILKETENLPQRISHYISVIDKSANHLLNIANDILDLSKIENNKMKIDNIEFNPYKEFAEIIELFTAKAEEKDVKIIFHIDKNIPFLIFGDPLRLKQILSNLISNAVKFTPMNGKIQVFVSLSDLSDDTKMCELEFSVIDSGIGISPEKQKTIFESFVQAGDDVQQKYGGTGLGLTISAQLVKGMKSELKVFSDGENGSKFYFSVNFKVGNVESIMKKIKNLSICVYKDSRINDDEVQQLSQYINDLSTLSEVSEHNYQECDILFVSDQVSQSLDLKSVYAIEISNEASVSDDQINDSIKRPMNLSKVYGTIFNRFEKDDEKTDKGVTNRFDNFKALIAEDHKINLQLIEALLHVRNIDYEVAKNGLEAYELYQKHRFDVVLMDGNMPVMDGLESTRNIRAYEKEHSLKHTPIVALTANAIKGDKERYLESGMDYYITKPIDESKLDKVFSEIFNKESDKKLFNLEENSKKMRLPMAVYLKIAKNFQESIDGDMNELKNAIDSKVFDTIYKSAHKLKGAAQNLKLDPIAQIALEIEESSKNSLSRDYYKLYDKLHERVEDFKQSDSIID